MELEQLSAATIREAVRTQGAAWHAAETTLSSLPTSEKLRRLGYQPGPNEPSLEEREAMAVAAAAGPAAAAPAAGAPAYLDWRSVGGHSFVTPIRDQGGCGSCVAFGTSATVEAVARVQGNDPGLAIDVSEAHLFYCFAALDGHNCETGWYPDAALHYFQTLGVVDEGVFPYTAGDQPCKVPPGWQNHTTKITGAHTITSTDEMKTWLSTKGPLSTCFTVYNDFFSYSGGIYSHVTGGVAGGHCVSVVGYDDLNHCWICKNSWGTGWGESGFFRIAYGQCGIDATMWAVEGVVLQRATTTALYRYWNGSIGDHFYTTDWSELGHGANGWGFEEIQCWVYSDPQPGAVPLYRYWNQGATDHFYTTNWAELGMGKYGWNFEEIQCWVCPDASTGGVALYRYWNPSIADHFYTTNWNELGHGANGWNYEGVQCYVFASAPAGAESPGPLVVQLDRPATFAPARTESTANQTAHPQSTGAQAALALGRDAKADASSFVMTPEPAEPSGWQPS